MKPKVLAILMAAALIVFAGTARADTVCANLTTALSYGSCAWTPSGQLGFFQQILPRSTGTGVIDPFLKFTNNGGIEQAYNFDMAGLPQAAGNDAYGTANYNHLVSATAVPTFPGGVTPSAGEAQLPALAAGYVYWQFMLDIDQAKNLNPSLMSLDQLQVFVSPSATVNPGVSLSGGIPIAPFSGAGLIYDLDGGGVNRWIQLNYSLNTGSGSGDMFFYVPVNTSLINSSTYVYLYSAFGIQGGVWANTNGPDEWALTSGGVTIVPEPATLLLLGTGLTGVGAVLRRRWRA